ncbi:MAG: hypothetical protein IIZ88_05250 [Prevotella sp.]|nr:hypothetical protein [Prevotella sp.]
MNNPIPEQWSNFLLKDVSFVNLMTHRIFNVLIIANPYDAFMLEDDGRVDEKIFNEYMELGLRYPPSFTQVSTTEEAYHVLSATDIDLVLCMPGNADNDAFAVARDVKASFPNMPCVVLTPFSHGITRRIQNEDLSIFDYVFCWLGDTNLILSIIKLIEDKMNIDHDIAEAGVQVIMLVEDNIRYYSSILPNLYSYILLQSKSFSTEALNPHAASQRKRGRPKVLLARTYEEAIDLYNRYEDNMLGVISDVRFPRDGKKDPDAGFTLLRTIRERNEYVPLIMQSAEKENEAKAMGDEYVSVEHIFLSMIKHPDKGIKEIFTEYGITRDRFLNVLMQVRGNQRVTSDSPEDTYDTLSKYGQDLVERAKAQKLHCTCGKSPCPNAWTCPSCFLA